MDSMGKSIVCSGLDEKLILGIIITTATIKINNINNYGIWLYRIAGKFGGLAVYVTTAKLKSTKISYSHIYVWQTCTEPPNLNLQSCNSDLGSTAKFNSRQYFQLYGMS